MDEIKNKEDLSKIIDLCRKKGVISMEIQGIKFTLLPEAPSSSYKKKKQETPSDYIPVESSYSEGDALFWSSAGIPENTETH